MKIGILLTDELRDALKPRFAGDYADMFVRLLDGNGFSFEVYDVREQQYPPTLHACDGYLITGSRHGAYEDLPWLPPLFAFIRQLHAAQVPLLGVCFGHQAVAQALGGCVEKSAKGWGVGAHTWQLTPAASWLSPPQRTLRLHCIHQDQVVQLPPGAVRLASSDFCENAAYAIGTHIFCVQGHPEFFADYVLALLDILAEKVPPDVLAAARESTVTEVDSRLCAQWMAQFFKQESLDT